MSKSKYERALEKICILIAEYTEECPYTLLGSELEECRYCQKGKFHLCWKNWAKQEAELEEQLAKENQFYRKAGIKNE